MSSTCTQLLIVSAIHIMFKWWKTWHDLLRNDSMSVKFDGENKWPLLYTTIKTSLIFLRFAVDVQPPMRSTFLAPIREFSLAGTSVRAPQSDLLARRERQGQCSDANDSERSGRPMKALPLWRDGGADWVSILHVISRLYERGFDSRCQQLWHPTWWTPSHPVWKPHPIHTLLPCSMNTILNPRWYFS